MEALIAQLGLFENLLEARDHQPLVEWRAVPTREHVSLVLPPRAGE
jgi:hypothetical protein